MATHLAELKGNVELYGWEAVHAFHAMWLQQIEQGHASWTNQDIILTFHQALMWHQPTLAHKAGHASLAQLKKSTKETVLFNVMVKLDIHQRGGGAPVGLSTQTNSMFIQFALHPSIDCALIKRNSAGRGSMH